MKCSNFVLCIWLWMCLYTAIHTQLHVHGKTASKIWWGEGVWDPIFSLVKIANLPELLMWSLIHITLIVFQTVWTMATTRRLYKKQRKSSRNKKISFVLRYKKLLLQQHAQQSLECANFPIAFPLSTLQIGIWLICNTLSSGWLTGTSPFLIHCL